MKKRFIIESHGSSDTRNLGKLMGRLLQPGSLIALSGELGSGKTVFVKGLASGLGVDRRYPVSSPSFVLINEYPGRIPLFHIDLYRLFEGTDLEEMGLEEYFYGHGVTAIEWAEKARPFIPSQHIWIDIQWTGSNNRRLVVRAVGKHNIRILEAIERKGKIRFLKEKAHHGIDCPEIRGYLCR